VSKLKVLITFDTEIWPGSWINIDDRFPQAFRNYVYGDTRLGQYALPMTLKILNDHGLRGVFFVEPMFSARFGIAPLQEIVGLIRHARQDVQMHLHTEWVDEAREPVLPTPSSRKRQHISQYSPQEQIDLIRWAKNRLTHAGAPTPTVYRAGSLNFNRNTIQSLLANEINADSSYSHLGPGLKSGLLEGFPTEYVPVAPLFVAGINEYPITVFFDRPGHLRRLQPTACSLREMTAVLERSFEQGIPYVNILSHNFELLDRRNFSVDRIVVKRYRGLCQFLERNRDRFETTTFAEVPLPADSQPARPVTGSRFGLIERLIEQAARRA
jgi:hypothetical protein